MQKTEFCLKCENCKMRQHLKSNTADFYYKSMIENKNLVFDKTNLLKLFCFLPFCSSLVVSNNKVQCWKCSSCYAENIVTSELLQSQSHYSWEYEDENDL